MNQKSDLDKYYELSYYTLAHKDPRFIHQNIVDAFAAQTADENTKPIKITFALIGLYLYIEKNYSGREVQLIHMKLAKGRKYWPTFVLPKDRGAITIDDVLATSPGKTRDEMIHKWCASVWQAYSNSRSEIIKLSLLT